MRTLRLLAILSLLLAAALLSCKDAPAPPPAQEQPAAAAAETPSVKTTFATGRDSFLVTELDTCEHIHGKRPEGRRSHFAAGTKRVWAWFQIRNTERRSHVLVRWGREAPLEHELRIHVGQNPQWHSWAPLDLGEDPGGWWTVEIAAPEGAMMASRRFFVNGSEAPQGSGDGASK